MALVTWCALVPQVYTLGFVIPQDWPRIAGVIAGTAVPVSVLTWVAMPKLVKLLHRWLYPGVRAERS